MKRLLRGGNENSEAPVITRREKSAGTDRRGIYQQRDRRPALYKQRYVDAHRKNLLAKLGAKNTASLVRIAMEHRLI